MPAYPSPPALKIPYDQDGSAAFYLDLTGAPFALTLSEMQATNDVSVGTAKGIPGSWGGTAFIGVIMSYHWDLVAYYVSGGSGSDGNSQVAVSTDSTWGGDGTWTDITIPGDSASLTLSYDWATGSRGTPDATGYRTGIKTVTGGSGIKAVRFMVNQNGFLGGTANIYSMHLYGTPTTTTQDLLVPWDPVLNQAATGSTQDFGDVIQSGTYTKDFRIKNVSATHTAHSVTMTLNVLTDTSPSLLTQFEFSPDGTTWSSTLNIGDIAPGGISAVIRARDQVAPTEPVGPHELRYIATAVGGWS